MADEKTTSSQQIRNIQLRRESSAATRVMTHDKDEMKYFLPVSGKRLSCLTFNCTLLSLEIRCTNKTSLFLQDCLGIIPFSLMSAVHSSHRSPFWAEITLRLGSQLCWLVRAIPGRSTAPAEDNCFSSRWGEQLTTWGRSPNPPGSLSERRVSGEDALLGRHFGETEWSRVWLRRHLSTEWIWYGELIFLGEIILNIQREEFGTELSTPNIVSFFYLILLMCLSAPPWPLGGL